MQGGYFVDVEAPIFPPLLVISSGSRLGVLHGTGTGHTASDATMASTHHGTIAALLSSRFCSVGVSGGVVGVDSLSDNSISDYLRLVSAPPSGV